MSIDLRRARALIKQGIGDLASCVIGESGLRPSIETAVHALIEYPVVVHLHSINALAWAVRTDGQSTVASKLRGLNWVWLDYARPGPELATALYNLLKKRATANVILLGNHGLVICAESVGEAEALVKIVEKRLAALARPWQPHRQRTLSIFLLYQNAGCQPSWIPTRLREIRSPDGSPRTGRYIPITQCSWAGACQ